MTSLKEQAIEMIRSIQDDKVIYVIQILKGITGLCDGNNPNVQKQLTTREALEGLKQYKGSVSRDIDEKSELAQAKDEKYAYIS